MKKTAIYAASVLALAMGAVAVSSCDSNYDDRYPEKYRSVVKFQEEGQIDLALYSTEQTQTYTINVLKGGWQPDAVVPTTVATMTDAEFDAYTADYGFTYLTAVPHDCYYFETPGNQTVNFTFSAEQRYQNVVLTIVPEKVNDFLLTLPASQTPVIPVILKADGATVDSDGQYLFLKPNYNEPTLGLGLYGVQGTTISPSDAKTFTINLPVALPVENKWDLKYTIALDEEALAGTGYALMDPSLYSGFAGPEQTYTFPQGTMNDTVKITIDGAKLPFSPVALPLKLVSLSGVDIDINPARQSVVLGYEVSLVSSYSTNDQEPSEGPLENLFDGNVGTFFHSTWSATATDVTHDPVYGSYVQFNLAAPLQTISFDFTTRANGNSGAPVDVDLYISNDGQNWSLLESITGMDSQLTGGGVKGSWGPFTAAEPFSYLRFCVLKSKAGSLTGVSSAYWNGAELTLINSAN